MPSELRSFVRESMAEYANKLRLDKAKILDVGTAGDKEKPSENYKYFAPNREPGIYFKTLDIDPRWQPDYVGDICATEFDDNSWDVVIVSQTLEHIYDFKKALQEIHRITKKWAIIDCPFVYPYHPEEPSFDDYWRIGPTALGNLLQEVGFNGEVQLKGGILTTALCQKK